MLRHACWTIFGGVVPEQRLSRLDVEARILLQHFPTNGRGATMTEPMFFVIRSFIV